MTLSEKIKLYLFRKLRKLSGKLRRLADWIDVYRVKRLSVKGVTR